MKMPLWATRIIASVMIFSLWTSPFCKGLGPMNLTWWQGVLGLLFVALCLFILWRAEANQRDLDYVVIVTAVALAIGWLVDQQWLRVTFTVLQSIVWGCGLLLAELGRTLDLAVDGGNTVVDD